MVEQEIYAVLSDFLANGPTKEELLRVKSKYFAGFIKGIERIGGFGGKSDVLAESEIFGDTPEYYRTYNEYIEHASLHDLQNIAFEWLNTGSHTILAKPFPEYETEAILADRAALPLWVIPQPRLFPFYNGLLCQMAWQSRLLLDLNRQLW